MRNFTRMFLAVFAALATAGIVLFYIYVPYSGDTAQHLDVVRERLARYLGAFGSLYLVLVSFLVIPSAVAAAGTGVAAAGGRPARSVALKVLGLSLIITVVGGLLGSLSWMGVNQLANSLKVEVPKLTAEEDAKSVEYSPKVLLKQRMVGFLGGGKPVSGDRGIDPVLLIVLTLLMASAVAMTRPGGPLRNLIADSDEAMSGLFKNLTFWIAPTAVFLLIVAWLLTAWPKTFSWFAVLVGSTLVVLFIVISVACVALAGSQSNVTPNYLLRTLRLPHVTAVGLGSPVLAIPQTMESCDECLAFTPLEKGIAIPLASVLARPGTAAVIAFVGMGALQLIGPIQMWFYPAVGLMASLFALSGTAVSGGAPVLILASASTVAWGSSLLATAVGQLSFIGVLALRVAAAVDVTAATVVGTVIRRGSIPEDLDPDLHPGELIRLARQRRRRALRTRSDRSPRGGDQRRKGGGGPRRRNNYRGDGGRPRRDDGGSRRGGDKKGGRRPRRDNRSRDGGSKPPTDKPAPKSPDKKSE